MSLYNSQLNGLNKKGTNCQFIKLLLLMFILKAS